MKEEEKQILKIFKRNLNFLEAQKKKVNLEASLTPGVKLKKTTTKRGKLFAIENGENVFVHMFSKKKKAQKNETKNAFKRS
jgi:hypothetical protein